LDACVIVYTVKKINTSFESFLPIYFTLYTLLCNFPDFFFFIYFFSQNRKVFRTVVAGRLVNRNLNLLKPLDPATGQFQEDITSPFFFFEPNRVSVPRVAAGQ